MILVSVLQPYWTGNIITEQFVNIGKMHISRGGSAGSHGFGIGNRFIQVFIMLCFLVCTATAPAQDYSYRWAKTFGGVKGDFGISLVTDRDGNVYSTGYFFESVDFDSDSGQEVFTGAKYGSAYLTSWDASGNYRWTKILTNGGPQSIGMSVDVDPSGNIYVAGVFVGSQDFDPGPGSSVMTAVDSTDIFIVKYDPRGQFIWAKQFIGNTPNNIRQLKVDGNGNVYTTGVFEGSIDFDPGPAVFQLTDQDGASFVAKLDTDGKFLWAKRQPLIFSFDLDQSGNLLCAGNNTVSKLDAGGNALWSVGFEAGVTSFTTAIASDPLGNVFITGRVVGNTDMDPGPGEAMIIDNGNDGEVFVTAYDSNGKFKWTKQFGITWRSPGFDPASLDADGQGNVYLAGDFIGSVDFDPGACEQKLLATEGYMYLIKLDGSGNLDWVKQVGGKEGAARPSSIHVDRNQELYTIGWFSKTVDLDPGPAASRFSFMDTTSSFGGDVFVMKLGPKPICGSSELELNICGSYKDSCAVYTSSGTYMKRITLPGDCDSVVIIKLNIDRIVKDTAMTVCKSYLWGDTLLTSSKRYSKTFKTTAGCDSIVNLYLTVLKVSDTLIRRSVCEGQDVFGYKKNGRYTDTLTTLNGCDSIRVLELTIVKPPRPDLGSGRKVCDDTLWLDAGDYDRYRWQDGSTERVFGVTRPGLYTVEVGNICGKATASAEVKAGNCDVWFPNAFSPDSNGLNDMFKVLTDLRLNDYFLQVFDRWGRKIFESRDQRLGWDGKMNGQPATPGNYIWQCSYRKSNDPSGKTKKGTVMLVR